MEQMGFIEGVLYVSCVTFMASCVGFAILFGMPGFKAIQRFVIKFLRRQIDLRINSNDVWEIKK